MAKRRKKDQPEVVRRDGGLCATFVNSASARRKTFSSYAELLAWGLRCGAVTAADGERLGRIAADHPDAAEAVTDRALELRASLVRIFAALAAGKSPSADDLEFLNDELSAAFSARRLVPAAGGFRWAWGDRGGDDLDRMLWPVLESMAEVLTTKYRSKVRRCAGEDCDLLFVDRTPGSPRKWCSMNACGSKVSSRRNYHRRIKPQREAYKRKRKRSNEEYRRRLAETRERESQETPTRLDGRPPGPRVA